MAIRREIHLIKQTPVFPCFFFSLVAINCFTLILSANIFHYGWHVPLGEPRFKGSTRDRFHFHRSICTWTQFIECQKCVEAFGGSIAEGKAFAAKMVSGWIRMVWVWEVYDMNGLWLLGFVCFCSWLDRLGNCAHHCFSFAFNWTHQLSVEFLNLRCLTNPKPLSNERFVEDEWPLFVRCDRTTDWWWRSAHLFILGDQKNNKSVRKRAKSTQLTDNAFFSYVSNAHGWGSFPISVALRLHKRTHTRAQPR